jgi:hypothetical protein
MKGFRKSTRIVYWVLRALAISSALLLFSVTGIVALQTTTHATATSSIITATSSSPAATVPDPTSTPTPDPAPSPTVAISPTPIPTMPPPLPTPTPKAMPTPPVKGIPTPPTRTTGIGNSTPTTAPVPTATRAALGPAAPLPPTQTLKGTPDRKPSPTPPGSPTPNAAGTPASTPAQGNTLQHPSTANDETMATIQPLIWPVAGVSTTILLSSAGLLALMYWRKRARGAKSSRQRPSFQNATPWMGQQAASSAQPTAPAPAQNRTLSPFAMQSIAQYSPLLGSPDTSQVDAPASPPLSDFRPLPVDYPQILEVHTDKTPVPVTPATLPSISKTKGVEERQAELQLASMPFSPLLFSPTSLEAGSMPAPIQTPIPSAQQNAPIDHQFPPHDSILETLMQQVQMGIFALPGKDG